MDKRLELVLNSLNKKYGADTIKPYNERVQDVPVLPTGLMELDNATGVGGYPFGRIIEIYGAESSGKTTLALQAIASFHKLYPESYAAFIDVEHALDKKYAINLGVDFERLLFSQPTKAEEALTVLETLIKSGQVKLLVLDSVASLVPEAEEESDMDKQQMGLQARLMSKALRKIVSHVSSSECIVIFINQTRSKIGMVFGNPETTPGGNAMKFYASMRLTTSAKTKIKLGEKLIGMEVLINIIKNKLAPPFTSALVELEYGKGFCPYRNIVEPAIANQLLQKSGSWYSYEGNSVAQGKENMIKYLKENLNVYSDLKEKLLKIIQKPLDT